MGKGHVMLYLAGVVSLSGIKLNGLPLQLDSYIYIYNVPVGKLHGTFQNTQLEP